MAGRHGGSGSCPRRGRLANTRAVVGGPVRAWVVNEPVERADVVFILGGGAQFRSFEAVRLPAKATRPRCFSPPSNPELTSRTPPSAAKPCLLAKCSIITRSLLVPARKSAATSPALATRSSLSVRGRTARRPGWCSCPPSLSHPPPQGPRPCALRRLGHSRARHRGGSARLPLAGMLAG